MYQSGQNVGNFLAGVADKAADFACDLYQGFPGAIIRSPIGAFNRGLMDSLCGPRNKLPPPPGPQTPGGQCVCEQYLVQWSFSDPEDGRVGTGEVTVLGPVRGVRTEDSVGGQRKTWILLSTDCDASGNSIGIKDGDILFDGSAGSTVTVTSVTKVDGSADNCGDASNSWNPNLPDVIPDDRKSGDVIINNNDGTSVNLPIVLIGSGNVINFNPEFKVDVGGIEVTFDVGGVSFDFGNPSSDPSLPPPRNDSGADNFERIEDAIERIRERIEEQQEDIDQIKKDRNDSPPPDEDPEIEKEEDEEEDDSGDRDVDKLQYVCVHLTKLPNREQWGESGPNVYYAGWLEFRIKDCYMPRQPIHFSNSIFKAPEGATGFAYTLTNGARGRVTVYKSKS